MKNNKIVIIEDTKKDGTKYQVFRYHCLKYLLPTERKLKILENEPIYSVKEKSETFKNFDYEEDEKQKELEPDENFLFSSYNNFYYSHSEKKEKHYKKKIIPYTKKYGAVGDYYIEYKHIDPVKNFDSSLFKEQNEFSVHKELDQLSLNPLFAGLIKNLEVYCQQEYKLIAIYDFYDDIDLIDEESWIDTFMGVHSTCPYLSCIVNIEFIGFTANDMTIETRLRSIQFQSHRKRLEKIGYKITLLYDYEKNFKSGIRPSTMLLSDGGNFNCGGANMVLFMRLDKYNEHKKRFINKNIKEYDFL